MLQEQLTPAEVRKAFPGFTEPALLKAIAGEGSVHRIAEGATLIDYGGYIRMMPLVIEGSIKVSRLSEDGSELFLYYLLPGDSCTMTFSCCSGNRRSEIRATTEEDTVILGLPLERFGEWMMRFRSWQEFVLGSYSRRMHELIGTVDQIAFKQLDTRLHDYIEKRAQLGNGRTVKATHRGIAGDLNVSREAISRLLKVLEKRGAIAVTRHQIDLLQPAN